jgi:methionine sulfoxide reductase heme-binding subunit
MTSSAASTAAQSVMHSVSTYTGSLLAASGSSPSPLWYATRATGVVALLLLTATVALGVAGIARVDAAALPRVVRSGLHRNVSLLALAFVCVHILTTVLDPFTSISIVSAIVPFSSSYRPLWLGLGAIAFDLLLAVIVTSLLRSRLPYRAWRAVHWLAYASWPVALWHGLGTGTDSRLPWLLLLDAACVLVVAGAVLWRLRLADNASVRLAGMIATSAFVLATIVFVAVGPLQHGWARRAGTPGIGAADVRPVRAAAALAWPGALSSVRVQTAPLHTARANTQHAVSRMGGAA